MFFHDNNPIASVGDTFTQGDLIGHTGTAGNVTGDHMHFNTATGIYAGGHRVPPANQWELINSEHIYDICYDNNTVIVEGLGYNWQSYNGEVGSSKKKNFPWVLYARKIRNNLTN
jgi:murein DD-endopeptidase MepM/ murein hydrolase activator NlpD